MFRLTASSVSLVAAATAAGLIKTDTQTQTLVVLDSWATIETHSLLLKYLEENLGHNLSYQMGDSKIKLKEHDNWNYDNIVMMAPSIKENMIDDNLKVESLVAFFQAEGHNLIAFGDLDARRHHRTLALQFGIDYEPFHYELVDSQTMYSHGGKPVLMSTNVFKPLTTLNQPVFSTDSKVAFQGIGQTLDPKNNFVFPILHGEVSTQSRSIDEKGQQSSTSGEQLTLVSGYQSRNNHRAVFTGSLSMCSDEFFATFNGSATNRNFCEELMDWALQASGVLRVSDIIHQKEGTENQNVNPENYFIEDRIEYFVTIDQKVKGQWVSYEAEDLQLTFVMLDPYIRTPLKQVQAGTYTTKFRTPQRLGIFKFSVDYMRHGLSYLNLDDEVSVIQWRHDAFPRFMHRAAPFYVSMFVLMAGFFVLVITFLFGGDRATNQVKKVQ